MLTNFLIRIDFQRDPILGGIWFVLRLPESIKVRKLRRVEGLEEAESQKAMAGSGWVDSKVDYIESRIQKSAPQSLLAHFTCLILAFLSSNAIYS